LVDLCILLGTDFSITIPKVGPVTAFKLIRDHGNIEAILASEYSKGHLYSDQLGEKLEGWKPDVARKIFLNSAEEFQIPDILKERIYKSKSRWFKLLEIKTESENVQVDENGGDKELLIGSGEFRWPKDRNKWHVGLSSNIAETNKLLKTFLA
ncbi:Elongation of fatty acids protein 2, partial [Nowakowskiella sp. JEL0078]